MTLIESSTPGNNPNLIHGVYEPTPFRDLDSSEDTEPFIKPHADLDFESDYATEAEAELARLAWQSFAKRSH